MVLSITFSKDFAFRHVYLSLHRKIFWLPSTHLSVVFSKKPGQKLLSLWMYCPIGCIRGTPLACGQILAFPGPSPIGALKEVKEILSGLWHSQVVPEIWVLYQLWCVKSYSFEGPLYQLLWKATWQYISRDIKICLLFYFLRNLSKEIIHKKKISYRHKGLC